jgi:pimeloyl-ACP methyl ester carboxylesterase
MPQVVFLPGAGGSPEFWRPVADRLPAVWAKALLSWPGAGDQPHDPCVNSFEDLIDLTQSSIPSRSDLVAQSMGGVVAIGVALRYPEKIRRLVLVATSGGIDVEALGARDWRAEYQAEFPSAANWIAKQHVDYTPQLARVTAPTLLLWGDRDPISPLTVGRRLAGMLPDSRLTVLPGGTHAVASEQPLAVARSILGHLGGSTATPAGSLITGDMPGVDV